MKKLFLLALMLTISISIGTMLANNSPPAGVKGRVIMSVKSVAPVNVLTMDNTMIASDGGVVSATKTIEAILCKIEPLPEFNTELIVDFSVAICNNTRTANTEMNGGAILHRMQKAELTTDSSSFVANNVSSRNNLVNGGVVRQILKGPMNYSLSA